MTELQALDFRMPLKGSDEPIQIKIGQLEEGSEAQDSALEHNTGHVMWPSAVMLARYIARNPAVVLDRCCNGNSGDILELGAGCGLVGLTVASMLQRESEEEQSRQMHRSNSTVKTGSQCKIILTDYSEEARQNLGKNVRLNRLDAYASVVGLDFFDQQPDSKSSDNAQEVSSDEGDDRDNTWLDMDGNRHPQVKLILASEILCYSNDAEMVANTIDAALMEGGLAIVLSPDAHKRFGVAAFPSACRETGLTVQVTDVASGETFGSCSAEMNEATLAEEDLLARELDQIEGYSARLYDYDFTMFTVEKPISTVA